MLAGRGNGQLRCSTERGSRRIGLSLCKYQGAERRFSSSACSNPRVVLEAVYWKSDKSLIHSFDFRRNFRSGKPMCLNQRRSSNP